MYWHLWITYDNMLSYIVVLVIHLKTLLNWYLMIYLDNTNEKEDMFGLLQITVKST